MTVYPFIEAEKVAERNVSRACELLKVSRSAYYEHRKEVPSTRQAEDLELAAQIAKIHQDSKGRYGAPRVHAALKRQDRCGDLREGKEGLTSWVSSSGSHVGQVVGAEADHSLLLAPLAFCAVDEAGAPRGSRF